MIERQALDRVHRLGQTKPVKTIRYIIKSSFDESILKLQDEKLGLAEFCLADNLSKGDVEGQLEVGQSGTLQSWIH